MPDVSKHEQLLSAYLDGQLNQEERKQAEKLLADNPRYANLLEQWKDQGQQIRKLPRFELGAGFSDRVMKTIQAGSTTWPAGSSASNQTHSSESRSSGISPATWRTAAAAIMTLAAMMLLTLFAFPSMMKDLSAKNMPGFSKSSGVQAEGAFDDIDSQIAVDDSPADSGADADSFLKSREKDSGSKLDESVDSKKPELVTKDAMKKQKGNAFDGRQSRGASGLKGAPPTSVADLEPTKNAGANRPDSNEPTPGQMDQMSQQAIAQNAIPVSIGNNPPIEEILVIEMDDSSKQRFQQALMSNQIQVQANYGLADNEMVQQSLNKESAALSKDQKPELAQLQSNEGLEAWYIRSSTRQINQAMNELSQRADISLVQVPAGVANAMGPGGAMPAPAQPGMGGMGGGAKQMAEQPAKSGDQGPGKSGGIIQKQQTVPQIMASRNNNYAQQLSMKPMNKPDGVNQQQAQRRNRAGGIPEFDPEGSEEPFEMRTQEELKKEIAAIDQQFLLGTDPDQVRNFLLLVQTRPESAQAELAPQARVKEAAEQELEVKSKQVPTESAKPGDK